MSLSRRGPGAARAVVRAEVDHGRAELVGDPDRPQAWTLLVDGTAQSHVDLADPVHLEFEYVRRIGHLLDALDPAPPASIPSPMPRTAQPVQRVPTSERWSSIRSMP